MNRSTSPLAFVPDIENWMLPNTNTRANNLLFESTANATVRDVASNHGMRTYFSAKIAGDGASEPNVQNLCTCLLRCQIIGIPGSEKVTWLRLDGNGLPSQFSANQMTSPKRHIARGNHKFDIGNNVCLKTYPQKMEREISSNEVWKWQAMQRNNKHSDCRIRHWRQSIFSELYSLSLSWIVGNHKQKQKAGQDQSPLVSECKTALSFSLVYEQEFYLLIRIPHEPANATVDRLLAPSTRKEQDSSNSWEY